MRRPVEIYPEELDPLRFPMGPGPEYVALLAQKYKLLPMDLVIASGIEPLEFAERHREQIWPGAAIVFNGVIDGMLEGWQRSPKTTGVTMTLDVEGTLKLGLADKDWAVRVRAADLLKTLDPTVNTAQAMQLLIDRKAIGRVALMMK